MIVSHVGLTCQDPAIIERFYTTYFGFRRTRVFQPGPNQIVMLKSGDMYLELFQATAVSPMPAPQETGPAYPGWRHLCFAIADLDAKLAEMEADARITLGPVTLDDFVPGMKVCWIADPEGNILELNQGYADD